MHHTDHTEFGIG
ncbi:hypothetical protein CGCF415_v003917 [Colletotrichum fructicola]|nr:hypothetical protein CGCFRS4_v002517 [Colletotrichum fructicola]KAF4912329.1 hypothetical protein CGCF415_v003917 [Colletotrichum fructicola]KAF4934655.1 hypothetical protein CGCF245_v008409 [Colletotrichum fructicola]